MGSGVEARLPVLRNRRPPEEPSPELITGRLEELDLEGINYSEEEEEEPEVVGKEASIHHRILEEDGMGDPTWPLEAPEPPAGRLVEEVLRGILGRVAEE